MIWVMNSSLKIVWKKKTTFLLSETLLFFLEQKYISFSETYFFKIPKNLITSAFFLPRQILKNRYILAKASNAELVKVTDWIIKNNHVISCAMYFCKWFKHDQMSNVIWLYTTWILIFQLKVANEKPLFTTKPAGIWTEISC